MSWALLSFESVSLGIMLSLMVLFPGLEADDGEPALGIMPSAVKVFPGLEADTGEDEVATAVESMLRAARTGESVSASASAAAPPR